MVGWMAAALCAFFVKGLCGFANTLVFTSLLGFGASNLQISPVDLLLGYPPNLIMAWKERRSIRWRMCLPLCALVLAGSIPGALFLKNMDARLIKIGFGVLTMLLGLEMLLRRQQSGHGSKAALAVVGALSGLMCGLYGVGALLGAYFSRTAEDTHSFRGNLCLVFAAENTFRILLYALWGILTAQVVWQTLLLAPAMLLGLWLGMRCQKVLDEALARRVILAMLIVSGAALIVNSL